MGKLLEYKGYHTAMNYDADDNILVGRIIGISDVIGFHANSVEEFKMIFYRTVDDYLDYCKEIGKEPDKEYKGVFNIRITPELHKMLVMKAESDGETLNSAVARAIKQYVTT